MNSLRCILYVLCAFGLSDGAFGQSLVFQYLYDDRSQLAKVVDSTGTVLEYVYDSVGNILQVKRSTLPGVPGALNVFSFTPPMGGAGTVVTVQGQGFSTTPSANVVRFNGVAATVLSATVNTLRVVVPQGAASGAITVNVGTATAATASSFTAVTVPLISSINPKTALPGTSIATFTVTGANLTGATFSFTPQFIPAAIVVSGVSINPSGTSATMSLALSANAAGTLVLVATIATGSSDPFPSAGNSFRVLNPLGDEDRDGLTNGQEATRGTDIFNPDTDGDGFIDGVEVEAGSDPLLPNSTPVSINPFHEGVSKTYSELNRGDPGTVTGSGADPSNSFREAVARAFSMLNTGDPGTVSGPGGDPSNTFREAATRTFSMLNTGDPGTVSGAGADPSNSFREVVTRAFSMLNTGDPGTVSGAADAYHEALGLLFSLQNLAVSNFSFLSSRSAEPSSAARVSTRIRPQSAGQITLALSPSPESSVLYEGQTIVVGAVSGAATSIEQVDMFVNGELISVNRAQPFETTFTVPVGQQRLIFTSVVTDTLGRRSAAEPLTVAVMPDPLTRVEGRLQNADGSPAPPGGVVIEPSGLLAEFYPLNAGGADVGDPLRGPALVTKLVSAINTRNPKGVFGPDPVGAAVGPTYIARFRGLLWVREGGRFEFVLGADSSTRLLVNGIPLLELSDGVMQFQERTVSMELAPGLVPIELIQFRNQGHGEIQLSYTPPGDVRQVIPPEALLAGPFGAPVATGGSGLFVFQQVPAIADGVRVRVRTLEGGEQWRAISGRVPLIRNAPTDLGVISLSQGEVK